ncbi:hypothetical protein GmHk_17G049750 [Glycine max]|nr:hypothetical protein GmHk_17G049750 [Glycine max]
MVVEKPHHRLKHVVVGTIPMEMSSSSYNLEPQSRMMCLCNLEAPLVTSWTEDNPRRHFYGCGLYRHDPIMNSREKRIIIALMKKVDELKFKENSLQTKISDMKMKGKIIRD